MDNVGAGLLCDCLIALAGRCICADGKRIALLIGNRDYARSPTRSTTFALSGRRSHEPTSRAASLAAPVDAVVTSSNGKSDQPVGSLEVKGADGWETSQIRTGRRASTWQT